MLNDASDNNSTESSRLRKKKNIELKCLLKARGLRVGGKKDDLIARLLGREKPKAKVEKWEKSKARKLPKQLAYDKRSNIHSQSAQEVHASHDWFKIYPLDKFEGYFNNTSRSDLEAYSSSICVSVSIAKVGWLAKFPLRTARLV